MPSLSGINVKAINRQSGWRATGQKPVREWSRQRRFAPRAFGVEWIHCIYVGGFANWSDHLLIHREIQSRDTNSSRIRFPLWATPLSVQTWVMLFRMVSGNTQHALCFVFTGQQTDQRLLARFSSPSMIIFSVTLIWPAFTKSATPQRPGVVLGPVINDEPPCADALTETDGQVARRWEFPCHTD